MSVEVLLRQDYLGVIQGPYATAIGPRICLGSKTTTPKSWNMDVGGLMRVFLLSRVLGVEDGNIPIHWLLL